MTESNAGRNAVFLNVSVGEFVSYFKNNKKINPKVIDDLFTIANKLPCNIYLDRELDLVVNRFIA